MKKIEASDFMEQCLELLEDISVDGLIITRDGAPVARVLPIHGSSADHSEFSGTKLIGSLRGKLKIKGNILSTGCEWEAEEDP